MISELEIIEVMYSSTMQTGLQHLTSKEIEKSSYGNYFAVALKRLGCTSIDSFLNDCRIQKRMIDIEAEIEEPKNHSTFIELSKYLSGQNPNFLVEPKNKTTNWRILFEFNKYLIKGSAYDLFNSINAVLKKRLHGSIIWDSSLVCSNQYSIFSYVLLEIIRKHFLQDAYVPLVGQYRKNLKYIASYDCNWYGRGKKQIFGYALFIYWSALCFYHLSVEERVQVSDIIRNLKERLSGDCIQLVLGGNLKPFQSGIGVPNSGWYQYNSYIDYFFFSWYFLKLSIKELQMKERESSVSKGITRELELDFNLERKAGLIQNFYSLFEPIVIGKKFMHFGLGTVDGFTDVCDSLAIPIDKPIPSLFSRFRIGLKFKKLIIGISIHPFKLRFIRI